MRPLLGDVQAAVGGQAGEEHVAEAEHRRGAAGGDVLHHRLVADDAEHRADAVDRLELAEVGEGGLHVGLAGAVGDEDEAGLVAEALLLHRADRHAVVAEHAGDLGEHARAVEHLEVEVVGGLGVVDRPEHRLAELADRRVRALVPVDGGVDEVAEDGAGGRRAAGAAAVEHEVADGGALHEDGVEALAHGGQRVLERDHGRVHPHADRRRRRSARPRRGA